MTTLLDLAARNLLASQPSVIALIGTAPDWGPAVFNDEPTVTVENSQKALIVVTESGSWAGANLHNTASFPRLIVDIWADPDRNPDKSVRVQNAKEKINAVHKEVKKFLHTVNMSDDEGRPIMWGTPEQIEDRTGYRIHGSQFLTGPEFYPVRDGNGAFMGTFIYGVSTD